MKPAFPWRIEEKPFQSAGHTSNIIGAGNTIKILPSTSRTRDQVDSLAKRIAAIPVYEAALMEISMSGGAGFEIASRALKQSGAVEPK